MKWKTLFSNLTGLQAGVGISSNSTAIGYGITSFNVIGTGVTVSTSSNVATISFPTTRLNRQSFTATAGQTTFNIRDYNPGYIEVYRNGARLEDDRDYTATTGNTLVLGTAATLNDNIDILFFEALNTQTSSKLVRQSETATANQTTFTITGGYDSGYIDIFQNGVKLSVGTDVTASNGSTIVLTEGAAVGDIIETTVFKNVILTSETKIDKQVYTATADQTTFTVTNSYTVGLVDVYLNGLKLIDGVDYTATNGSTVVLTTGASLSDTIEINAPKVKNTTNSLNSVVEENFTATANQTAFTTSQSFVSGNYIQVFKNGSKLRKTDFTTTPGNTVTLDNACTVGDELDIVIFL